MKVLIFSWFLVVACSSTQNEVCPPNDLKCPRQKFEAKQGVRIAPNPKLDSKMPMNNSSGETSSTRTDSIPLNDNPIPPTDMELR